MNNMQNIKHDPKDPTNELATLMAKITSNEIDRDNCLLLAWNDKHTRILFSSFLHDDFLNELLQCCLQDDELLYELGTTVKLLANLVNNASLQKTQSMN